MNLKELKAIAAHRTEAAPTVCALANGLGGFVLFGLSDKGEIVAQEVSVYTHEEIAKELRRIKPPIGMRARTIPEKPRNSKERYQISQKGRQWLAQQEASDGH